MKELVGIFSGGVDIKEFPHRGENCLNISIVTPCIDDRKRPVLVYIHGGGFTGGDSFVIPTICDRLCDEEDIVVASIEHRLGALGFLDLSAYDDEYATSGVNGMLDIILGLKWVQRNIGAFGGDPENVMLYGESGGAMKITTLLNMPEAKGLFAKVYLNSGACRAGIVSKKAGMEHTEEFLKALDLNKGNWRELLSLSTDKIIEAQKKVTGDPALTPFYPVADGEHLLYNESREYRISEEYSDTPMMLGASEDELMPISLTPVLTKGAIKKPLLNEGGGAVFKTIDGSDTERPAKIFKDLDPAGAEELIRVFADQDGHKRNCTHLQAMILSAFSFLGSGAYYLALAKSRQNAPVYLYEVAFDTPLLGKSFKSAWHTVDLPLSFRAVYMPEHEMISKHMAHAMACFMRTGSPDTAEMPWKSFDEKEKYTLVYGYDQDECRKDPYKEIHTLVDKYMGERL